MLRLLSGSEFRASNFGLRAEKLGECKCISCPFARVKADLICVICCFNLVV